MNCAAVPRFVAAWLGTREDRGASCRSCHPADGPAFISLIGVFTQLGDLSAVEFAAELLTQIDFPIPAGPSIPMALFGFVAVLHVAAENVPERLVDFAELCRADGGLDWCQIRRWRSYSERAAALSASSFGRERLGLGPAWRLNEGRHPSLRASVRVVQCGRPVHQRYRSSVSDLTFGGRPHRLAGGVGSS